MATDHQLTLGFISGALRFLFHSGRICIMNTINYPSDPCRIFQKSASKKRQYTGGTLKKTGELKFWLTIEGSKCLPRNDSSRLHNSPLPNNMNPVTSQNTRGSCGERKRIQEEVIFFFFKKKSKLLNSDGTSSKDDSKFIPKATPIRLNRVREKEPIVSCRPKRIITFRWLKIQRYCIKGVDLKKVFQ